GALATALTMLLHPNPVRAALFLVLNLFCVAVLYLLLNAYFLAAVQVVVYAGAIMVLFLFVIMLLNLGTPDRTKDRMPIQQPLAAVGGLVLAGMLALTLVRSTPLPLLDKDGNPPALKEIGKSATMAAAQMTTPGGGGKSVEVAAGGPGSVSAVLDATLPTVIPSRQGTVEGIGKVLYNPSLPYLFPFEVTSILLLVATIGSVVLAKRRLPSEEPLAGEDLS
ncbi:MAG: NADH-quinone oxidoreductase subunit J, partial [Alphaproteobacteria bacterium]